MQKTYPKYHLVPTGPIHRCQICNSSKVHLILDLGHQPLCDSLLTRELLDQPEVTYPLRMVWCERCTGVQIDYCVDGKEVYYPQYPYRTGITKPAVEYQTEMSRSLAAKYRLNKSDLVMDIGSNDGTLLSGFKAQGIKVLGVEPTNIAKYARKAGIRTVQSFFDIKTAKAIVKKFGKASVVTATNMFAHMQAIGDVVLGAYTVLKDDGVFVSETHYLLDVIQGGQFDTIYHEHLRTYSLRSLIALFKPYDFTVTDVERGTRYGGNIRVHVTKGRCRAVSDNVRLLLEEEKAAGLDKLKTYQEFASRVQRARVEFMSFLVNLKKTGQYVVGKSCPGRASTLLNYYGVDRELLPYLAELPNSLKLGMYLPGKHIPVVSEEILLKEQPTYLVLLSWHYADVIMERLRKAGLRSDFIIPLPDFRIVKN